MSKWLKIVIILIIAIEESIREVESRSIDLSANWTLLNDEFQISIENVSIPNSVHSILLANEYINDPLLGYNDINFRWIVYADGWVLKRVFSLESLPRSNLASLILDSVDTFATVYLNEKAVLNTSNQFVRYELNNVNDVLVEGENTIQVVFDSSVKKAQELARQYPYRYILIDLLCLEIIIIS
jgi:beta-mannosidase